ncbi:hypothetical protein HME9304_02048 [Flagellimonas maritima]|uniref:DUF2490 domain-containing protein n=1 Tax=Flagellimonas maritima TaxID=1383885 RepID=A0A2Z4LTL3_9FLAO|nr:DUF2490 domain-containing protein [Allomuricauda aurantiaca]AWX45040.1 hypothetical protein HME9304_02048 [Allomuricauda aurantiaca]
MGCAKRFPFILFFIAFSILPKTTFYGQSNDEERSGSWVVLYGDNKIHEKWSIPTVGILRHHEIFEKYEFAFIRTGISYKLSKSSTLTTGIAYLSSRNYTGSEEFRNATQFWVYEEYALKTKLFSHRFRLETRWKKNADDLHINNRLRYRFQYITPIYKNVHLRTFNEYFVNLEKPLFNQNRFYVGLGQTITPSIKVDIGYLKNHFQKSDHDVVRMSLIFKTDFTKKDVAQHN